MSEGAKPDPNAADVPPPTESLQKKPVCFSLLKILVAFLVWAIVILAVRHYVYLQWGATVKQGSEFEFLALLAVATLMGCLLSCLEVALSQVTLDSLTQKVAETADGNQKKLTDKKIDRDQYDVISTGLIHRDARLRIIIKNKEYWNHVIVTLITGIEISVTVIYITFLNQGASFHLKKDDFLHENVWPMSGENGFISVGFAVILLLVVNIIPNKFGMRNPDGCFLFLSRIILIIEDTKIFKWLIEGLVSPIDFLFALRSKPGQRA
jgi:hypothetical protein